MRLHPFLLTFAVLLILAHAGRADDAQKSDDKQAQQATTEKLSVTRHKTTIDGKEIRYTATAGKLTLNNDKDKAKAHVFFIAYMRDDAPGRGKRPLSFCFNGGPGSSSVWLHLGVLGPQRVKMPDDASLLQPPYRLSPNSYSLLDVSDLVFIDPVSTGYSRPAEGEDKSQFHGYHEDIRSVGQFIHDYTTRFERWPSPKFLIGESYGAVRAAGLSSHLQDRYHLELNGIVLVSAAMNFQTIRFSSSNDLPYVLFLPTYTATAWYHKALDDELQKLSLAKVTAQAEQFAIDRYAPVLLKGDAASKKERAEVAAQLARLTGLSRDYVESANLRVGMSRFGKELLRGRRLTIGRLDSRYTGIDRDSAGESYSYDPSNAAIAGPFTATMNDYLRRKLKYQDDAVYEVLTGNVHPWNYDSFQNRYADASESLRQAMTHNPHLKVLVTCGYYDLATPYVTMKYTIDHLGLPPKLRDNVSLRYYPAGHMMYIHRPSLKRLRGDLTEFYKAALPRKD